MRLEVVLEGRRVVLLGSTAGTAVVAKRYCHAGAEVSVAVPPGDDPRDRLYPVTYVEAPDSTDRSGWLDLLAGAHLVVHVESEPDVARAVGRHCGELSLLEVTEAARAPGGRVTLVGGGPGAPDLLTVAACRALQDADAVFYDRLTPHEQLETLAPTAVLVDVSALPLQPTGGSDEPGPAGVDLAMIARARAGEHVVRLKSGDPFVFSRGRAELQVCLDAGVPVTVVPGVSSALAVPAAAGIPVSRPGVASMVTVLSGQHLPPAADVAHLAALNQTLVVLVDVHRWPRLQADLLAAGLAAETPAAVIERGWRANQRSTVTVLGALASQMAAIAVADPAVIVLGAVVDEALTDAHAAAVLAGLVALDRPADPVGDL